MKKQIEEFFKTNPTEEEVFVSNGVLFRNKKNADEYSNKVETINRADVEAAAKQEAVEAAKQEADDAAKSKVVGTEEEVKEPVEFTSPLPETKVEETDPKQDAADIKS